MDEQADEPVDWPLWRAFPRQGGFVLGYLTRSRFNAKGVMTLDGPGAPLYALPDQIVIYPTEAEALAAAERFTTFPTPAPEPDR
jgi:hypothetical protein